ncbi:MAG: glucuronate isomerase [Oscillospiraceae bacterium]|nr:glucuronate isomerase [Oscillospiraceae bacterium]
MSKFMDEDFLLTGKTAKKLYHNCASKMPIIDYHCHIDPAEIYQNKRFADLSEIWLSGDHYKWRLMRASGIEEELITGNASNREKFEAFASILPRAIGNPVYHWAHLELKRFFDIDIPLNSRSAGDIWEAVSQRLSKDNSLRARGIIKSMNVKTIVTTDDPTDSLRWHKKIASDDSFDVNVLPCWRPDMVMGIDCDNFPEYIQKLSAADSNNDGTSAVGAKSNRNSIKSLDDLKSVLRERMNHFAENGCKASDHGIFEIVYAPAFDEEISAIFKNGLEGKTVSADDANKFKYYMLSFLAREYSRLNWVMQLHYGVLRNVNTALHSKLKANAGFDCIGSASGLAGLAKFLDSLNITGELPKTLIFSINPNDNEAINTLAACFTEEKVKGKVQQGSAWWFNDTYQGMKRQLISFAENGVLGNFIGMLTDSRSFTSYTRHEYFRRILCDLLGGFIDTGRYPDDMEHIGGIVRDICYNNARDFFGF